VDQNIIGRDWAYSGRFVARPEKMLRLRGRLCEPRRALAGYPSTPHEHAQHHCRRVLSVAYPGFLGVADIKGDVGATRCAEHARQLGGESPLSNLMEVKD
jgi:hypothetical protein